MRTPDAILFIILITLVITGIVFIFLVKEEGSQCIKDPVKFGLSKMAGNVTCSCFGDKGAVTTFSKDDKGNISFPLT